LPITSQIFWLVTASAFRLKILQLASNLMGTLQTNDEQAEEY